MAEDWMVKGYKQGKVDCRLGERDKNSYTPDTVYGIGYCTGWDTAESNGEYGGDKSKPSLFAVIKVNMDYYGSVDDLECVGVFETEEEAYKADRGYVVKIK